MERFTIERKKRRELEEKIEAFFKDRRRVREASFNELEEAVRKFGPKELSVPKLVGLFKYDIGAWKIFLERIGVSAKEITNILLTVAQNSGETEEKTIKEERDGETLSLSD